VSREVNRMKQHDSSSFLPLSLEEHFTLRSIATADVPASGTMDGMFGLKGEELPAPGPVNFLDKDFLFPDRGPGLMDCLVPGGQRVAVAPDRFGVLYIVGCSIMGSSSCEVSFDFDEAGEGACTAEILRLTDWCHEAQFGEQRAIRLKECYNVYGPHEFPGSIWMQVLFLPPGRNLTGLTFGSSPHMRIFAATLGREPADLPPSSLVRQLLVRLRERSEGAAAAAASYFLIEDIHRLTADSAIETKLNQLRQELLVAIPADDLFRRDDEKLTGLLDGFGRSLSELKKEALERLRAAEPRSDLSVTLAGHSHLDAVWLWPWNETVEKASRTFSRNLKRLDRYEEAVFVQSSPLFYAWMEERFPDIFEGIREKVRDGSWELLGGMWIEPDGNMPCGEALVRQRLFGQRFYLSRFGRKSEVAWVPDTFGMHGNHPQIIRKTGGKYFFTTKLMWNDTNVFPFQHFIWESPDGSRVLALQSAVGCGAMPALHRELEEPVRKHNVLLAPGRNAAVSCASPRLPDEVISEDSIPEVLCIYGEGDGGEGPSEAMVQRAETLSHLPGYRHGTVHSHFETIERKYGHRLPVWNDELFLECHRGTTTSQRRIKELNRRGEAALLSAEKWAALSRFLCRRPTRKSDLDQAWKRLLFNQFHDILPGTSLSQAYVDAELDFERLFQTCDEVRREALAALAARIDTLPGPEQCRAGKFSAGVALLIFNPLAWERHETMSMTWNYPGVCVRDRHGRELPSQVVPGGEGSRLLFRVEVPALGYTLVRLAGGPARAPAKSDLSIEGRVMENSFYRIKLNDEGNIGEIFDKALQRNLLGGDANHVRFFTNHPEQWSNWNIDPDFEKHELIPEGDAQVEIVERGPVAASFRVTRPAVGGGRLIQTIRLPAHERRIEFETDIDVRYNESLIKVVFPFDMDADFATTETAYGTYRRPTKPTSDFEKAKWEAWTQKWLDLSGPRDGVTLVNESTYGFDLKGGTIRLTLVKGGIMPDPETDVGRHRIRYALISHEGGFHDSHAWKRGYEFNFPLVGVLEEDHAGDYESEGSFGFLSGDGVCWEVIKEAEEGDALVLRFYEVEGIDRKDVAVTLPFRVKRAEEIDFLEIDVSAPVRSEGNRILLDVGRNEIKAVRVFPEEDDS